MVATGSSSMFGACNAIPHIEGTLQERKEGSKRMKDPSAEIGKQAAQVLLERVEALERKIKTIKMRNRRVEGDKAWETSHTRHFLVALITYILATAVLWLISFDEPYRGALIPTLGYVLSTLTLESVKRFWIARFLRRPPSG
jgi:hypothetical protein